MSPKVLPIAKMAPLSKRRSGTSRTRNAARTISRPEVLGSTQPRDGAGAQVGQSNGRPDGRTGQDPAVDEPSRDVVRDRADPDHPEGNRQPRLPPRHAQSGAIIANLGPLPRPTCSRFADGGSRGAPQSRYLLCLASIGHWMARANRPLARSLKSSSAAWCALRRQVSWPSDAADRYRERELPGVSRR
jgi:hypothetical protein